MKSYTKVASIIIGIMVLVGGYFIIKFSINNEFVPNYELDDYYYIPLNKKENEYTPISVMESDMASIYFNTFVNMMVEDVSRSYNYLSLDYRETYFPSVNSYRNYIAKLTENYTILPRMDKYRIEIKNDKKIYYVKDTNNNDFIFLTDGVMNYKVYLDESAINKE